MQEQFIRWLNNDSEEFQYVLYGLLLIIFITLEIIMPLRKHNMNRKERWLANFMMTFLNIMILGALPITFFSTSLYAAKHGWGLLNQIDAGFPIVLVLSLLLRGFISFFTHFLMHKVSFLWRLHRVHHLDTEIDISTTVRFHPLEFVVNLVVGMPLILFSGLSSWALLFYELFDVAITLLAHTNISFPRTMERLLRYIIVTPDLHRVHHSSYQPETDSNFSAVFPIWDLVFGTFRTETRIPQKEMELGLEEVRDRRTNSILWLLTSPFITLNKVVSEQHEAKGAMHA